MAKRRFNNREMMLVACLQNFTQRDAARAAGVSEKTMQRALKDPDFKSELDARRKEVIDNTCIMLQSMLPQAVKTAVGIMDDEDVAPQVRLNAADTIMRYTMRLTELCDVNDTVAEMKRRFEEMNVIDSVSIDKI